MPSGGGQVKAYFQGDRDEPEGVLRVPLIGAHGHMEVKVYEGKRQGFPILHDLPLSAKAVMASREVEISLESYNQFLLLAQTVKVTEPAYEELENIFFEAYPEQADRR